MALTLSTDDLARMTAAARVLASPLAYVTTDDWRREALRAVAAFALAETACVVLGTEARATRAHHFDSADEDFFDALLAPVSRRAGPSGIASLDAVVEFTRRRQPQAWSLASVDHALGGTGEAWRSEWYNDFLAPRGAGDIVAMSVARPTVDVVFALFGHRLPLADVVERLAPLSPLLAAGLDTLDRAGAHRAALDALDAAAAFFDADGREAHRTPALARLLAPDADGVRLAEALAALARRMARHAFGEAAAPPAVHVPTRRGGFTLRATRLAPGALRGTDAFLVTVAGAPAALPTAEALRVRYGLTRREAEVARLVACGHSNTAAARALSVSPHTVRHQLEAAMAKLGLSGRGRESVGARLSGLDVA